MAFNGYTDDARERYRIPEDDEYDDVIHRPRVRKDVPSRGYSPPRRTADPYYFSSSPPGHSPPLARDDAPRSTGRSSSHHARPRSAQRHQAESSHRSSSSSVRRSHDGGGSGSARTGRHRSDGFTVDPMDEYASMVFDGASQSGGEAKQKTVRDYVDEIWARTGERVERLCAVVDRVTRKVQGAKAEHAERTAEAVAASRAYCDEHRAGTCFWGEVLIDTELYGRNPALPGASQVTVHPAEAGKWLRLTLPKFAAPDAEGTPCVWMRCDYIDPDTADPTFFWAKAALADGSQRYLGHFSYRSPPSPHENPGLAIANTPPNRQRAQNAPSSQRSQSQASIHRPQSHHMESGTRPVGPAIDSDEE